MKKLGLIGGTGPESTIEYYRRIEYGVQAKTGAFPRLVIESLSVYRVLEYCQRRDYDGLTAYLLRGVEALAAAGADFAALTGITPHIVIERLAEAAPIPIVSMLDTARERAAAKGYRRVALLGTYPTMTAGFFQAAFARGGIEVRTPIEPEMRCIEEVVEKELELGRIVPESQRRLCDIARRLVQAERAEAVVLGCTELPLILNDEILSMPCLDVMDIHINKLIELLLEGDA